MIKTKIVCTIGPRTSSFENILKLIESGMNIARINFSHGTHPEHKVVIDRLKKARDQLKVPLAIMLDTKGPEVRVGDIPRGSCKVKKGDHLLLTDQKNDQANQLQIVPFDALIHIEPQMKVLFDDGSISSRMIERSKEGVLVEIDNDGEIFPHKGVNVPGCPLGLPALTEKDYQDIEFGCREDVDIISASFIRSAKHILQFKRVLKDFGKPEILVIAKIENYQGISQFDQILQVADGIMVARGDLGVEVPLSHVPRYQKEMIKKCFSAGKSVITATQMLESMIVNPRPTRAEVSDVANAIYDSTSAVMLSGESAVGQYPFEAVQVLKDVITDTEAYFDSRKFFYSHTQKKSSDVPTAVAFATVSTAYAMQAKAIFVFSSSGYTSRLISKWRSEVPIIVLTNEKKVYHQLSLNWGIIPIYNPGFKTMKEAFKIVSDYALEKQIVALGDIVVVTAGSPFGVSGSTNMMLVENVGDVLLRGQLGHGEPISGKVTIVKALEEELVDPVLNSILVMTQCDDTCLQLLKDAKGIILENDPSDLDSEKYALLASKTLNIPLIAQASGASKILKDGQVVTLSPDDFLVYKGSVPRA